MPDRSEESYEALRQRLKDVKMANAALKAKVERLEADAEELMDEMNEAKEIVAKIALAAADDAWNVLYDAAEAYRAKHKEESEDEVHRV